MAFQTVLRQKNDSIAFEFSGVFRYISLSSFIIVEKRQNIMKSDLNAVVLINSIN